MGEESTSCVYIGSYEDGKIVYEPLAMNVAVDMDLGEEESVDISSPLPSIQAMMGEPITLSGLLCRKGLRRFYKVLGVPAYLRTEFLFPKKKKRGTARRKRKLIRYEQKFRAFIKEKYGSGLIGTRATQPIIDDFFIPDGAIPPVDVDQAIPESEFDFVVTNSTFAGPAVSREEYLEKASFSSPWPGPFEGEEE